jgi:Zn-dependent protease with chaperone function
MADRKVLVGLAPQAWEHPADLAALRALRAVPGFDEVLKRLVGSLGERGVRLLFQANAVRVSPTQLGRIDAVYGRVLATMDCAVRPELFVSQSPTVQAGAYGIDQPFVVLHSGTIELLDDDELAFVIGHELGHILSGHALYHTMLRLILMAGTTAAPWMLELVRWPLQIALLEWYRKSELSCDRAGLLAVQDRALALRTLLHIAGGRQATDIEAFVAQGREHQAIGGVVDRIFKVLNVIGRTHPLLALRAAEIDTWANGEDYARIVQGEYAKRGEPARSQPVAEAAAHYARGTQTIATELATSAKQAADAARGFVHAVGAKLRKD